MPLPTSRTAAIAPLLTTLLTTVLTTVLLALPAPQPVMAQVTNGSALPALGDEAGDELSVPAEARLGERIMQQLRRDPDVVDDPLLVEYIERLWSPLLAAAKARGDVPEDLAQHLAWQTFVVRDRTINAFALPGGHVGVHMGLVAMTSTRDELASVLAHELSHVSQRHIARMMSSSRRSSMLALATTVLGIMALSRSPDAAQALVFGGQAVAIQGQLNFSRDMEREADRIGSGILQAAGYDGIGMVGMFERMASASRLTDSNAFPYLRSHPLTGERIADARNRLGVDAAAAPTQTAGSGGASALWLHAAMQGRARALMDLRDATQQQLASQALPTTREPASLATASAVALAATRLKLWGRADLALARARELAAPHESASRAVVVLRLDTLIARGDLSGAIALLQSLEGARIDDGSRAGMLEVAQVLIAARPQVPLADEPLRRQVDALQVWVSGHPEDAGAWDHLSQLQRARGQTLAALRADAEAHAAVGDWQGAADRLRAGQRQSAQDPIEGAVIDARLKVVEQRRRQQLQDERRGE
ncbi:putative Zn-dependent protease [Sphaerotilus mobilis]|uniref:Putative Zn-dependent protease n=1 Tax=Sphaerotilus mobilis TaxID=47994 RepID=A0A4Q7L900_9BURK|nr:putative Zn-dependent protease [Sphaerotilus mobilis]